MHTLLSCDNIDIWELVLYLFGEVFDGNFNEVKWWLNHWTDTTTVDGKQKITRYNAAFDFPMHFSVMTQGFKNSDFSQRTGAFTLDASGKQSEAIKVLETLKDYSNASPRNEADLSAAYELLIKFYANIKAWDKGLELSKKLMYAGDAAAAVSALFARGDILSARASETNSQDDRRDAFNAYAQICLLFPKNSRAAEATFRAYQTLTVLNDARAKIFADKLKKDYPKSDYAKQL